jgi:hypothetical protein
VIQINADGGAQQTIATRGAGAWIDPIDIAVDRDGLPTPTLRTKTVPEFLHVDREEGSPAATSTGVSVPLFPLQQGSLISVYCVGNKACPGHEARHLVRRFTVPAARSKVTLAIGTQGRVPTASISVCKHWPNCPPKQKVKHLSVTVSKGKPHHAKRSVASSAKKKGKKKKKKKRKSSRAGVNGRYYDLLLTGNANQALQITGSGCLQPGETTVSRKKPKTVIACPAP